MRAMAAIFEKRYYFCIQELHVQTKPIKMNRKHLRHIPVFCGIFAAVAAATLCSVSCHKDTNVKDTPVRLSAEAASSSIEFSAGNAVGVFGYTHKSASGLDGRNARPDFFMNQRLDCTGASSWTYDPTKYWPHTAGESISFFGYYPYADSGNGIVLLGANGSSYEDGQAGLPLIKYIMPERSSGLVKAAVSSIAESPVQSGGDIRLAFSPIMTDISISIDYGDIADARPGITVLYIEKAWLSDICTSGTYDCAAGEWDTASEKGSVRIDHDAFSDMLEIRDFAHTVTSVSLPVLPQTIPSKAAINVSGSYVENGVAETFTVSVPISGTWKKGGTASYGISIDGDTL